MMRKTCFIISIIMAMNFTHAWATDYLIGEGDALLVSVWGERDLSVTVRVRPDGKITIPAIGEVNAANTTVKGLQTLLIEKIRMIVKNPIVTVSVTEITNNKVYITGGFLTGGGVVGGAAGGAMGSAGAPGTGARSGVFTLTQRTSLFQLLCQIDDVRKADLKKAYLQRAGKKIKEDFTKLYLQGETGDDIALEPNDIIYIAPNVNKNIYIMGAVTSPRFIEYREGLTVMEAILEAGGFTKYASQNDTVIYRKDGVKENVIPVKIKKLINDGDLSQNPRLQPGDYIVVKEGVF